MIALALAATVLAVPLTGQASPAEEGPVDAFTVKEDPPAIAYVFVAVMGVFLVGLVVTASYLFYRAAREEF